MHPSCSNAAAVSGAERTGKRVAAGLVILLMTMGAAIYSNVLQRGIFIFDDFEYVVESPIVKDLSRAALMSDPRQVGYLSFALNYAIDPTWDPFGFHVVNVIIHILNAVAIFFLLQRVSRKLLSWECQIESPDTGNPPLRWTLVSALAALAFLVHPLETQAVAYITQRFTSLSAFFYVMAILAYLSAREKIEKQGEGSGSYVLLLAALLLTILGMKTKETAFTIPPMLAILEYLIFRDSKFGRRRYYFIVPFLATMIIIPLSLLGPEFGLMRQGIGVDEVTRQEKLFDLLRRSAPEYFFTQIRVIVIYLRLMLLPVNQLAVYDLKASQSLFEPGVLLSLALLLSLAGSGIYCWRRAWTSRVEEAVDLRMISFGIIWFFVTLSVESSFLPIKDLIFEHRAYLPSIGIFTAVSVLLLRLAEWLAPRAGELIRASMVAFVIVVPLSVAAHARNEIWTDEVLFWSDIVDKTGKAIGYNNRGTAYVKRGEYKLALRDLDKTISFFPSALDNLTWERSDFTPTNMAKTFMTRGNVYEALGDAEKAAADRETARRYMEYGPGGMQRTAPR